MFSEGYDISLPNKFLFFQYSDDSLFFLNNLGWFLKYKQIEVILDFKGYYPQRVYKNRKWWASIDYF